MLVGSIADFNDFGTLYVQKDIAGDVSLLST